VSGLATMVYNQYTTFGFRPCLPRRVSTHPKVLLVTLSSSAPHVLCPALVQGVKPSGKFHLLHSQTQYIVSARKLLLVLYAMQIIIQQGATSLESHISSMTGDTINRHSFTGGKHNRLEQPSFVHLLLS
jgi:hypothetical protein